MDYLTWETIPQHILVNVFCLLPVNDRLNASLACKYWSECFHNPMLWSKFIFKFDTEIDNEGKAMNCIEKYSNVLKDVKILLNQSQKISRERACSVMEKLSALKKKKLISFEIKFTGTNPLCFNGQEILQSLKKLFSLSPDSELIFYLTSIDFNHCNIALDNELISIFATYHTKLRVFKVKNSCLIDNVTPKSILNLIENCKCLQELHTFYHCIDSAVIKALSDPNRLTFKKLSLMCNRSDKFHDLIPSEPWMEFAAANPTAEVIIMFHSSIPHYKIIPLLCPGIPLVYLDLKIYGWLAEELSHIAETFSSTLKYLSFNTSMDCFSKAPPGVEPALLNLAERCEKLQELHCYCALNGDVIVSIQQKCSLKNYTLYRHASDISLANVEANNQ